jgi:hypothetical protein
MPVTPQYSDESWLAVDADGFVGWFTVNGAGAILTRSGVAPAEVLAAEFPLTEWARSQGQPFVFGHGEQWREIANVGLFAFDHDAAVGGYTLLERPVTPEPLGHLPEAIAQLAALTTFRSIRFATTPVITTALLEAEDT